jgi:DNA polymerase-3 subunit alpha
MRLFDVGESVEPSNHPALLQIAEWDKNEFLAFEKETLGFYITDHPLTSYQNLLDKFTNANTVSVNEFKDGSVVRIGGIIRNIKTIRTKKGDLMAFVAIEDMDGSTEITVFSKIYDSVSSVLTTDNPVLVQGQIQHDENSVKILADDIIPIEKAEEAWIAKVRLKLNMTRTSEKTLSTLKEVLTRHPGSCPGYVHLVDPDKTETIIALPETLKLKAGSALTREVKGLLGYAAVETDCTPVPSSAFSTKNNLTKKQLLTVAD